LRDATIWAVALAVVAGGYGVAAPVVDDWRSGLRAMSGDCRVAHVVDGDTVDLRCQEAGTMRARIVGYDSPELYSPRCERERAAAERARQALASRVRHATGTEVAFLGHDRYGRALVDMRLSGQRVARGMVESGNGRRYFGSLRGGWC
jgi:endonuclease YncB( thermonuclease family)